jgi:hypothetical protein
VWASSHPSISRPAWRIRRLGPSAVHLQHDRVQGLASTTFVAVCVFYRARWWGCGPLKIKSREKMRLFDPRQKLRGLESRSAFSAGQVGEHPIPSPARDGVFILACSVFWALRGPRRPPECPFSISSRTPPPPGQRGEIGCVAHRQSTCNTIVHSMGRAGS